MKKKLNDKFYTKSDLEQTDWYKYIVNDRPDYIDVYTILDGYAKMNLSKLLSSFGAGAKTELLDEIVDRLANYTGCDVTQDGTSVVIDFTGVNVAEVDEYDYGGNFAAENAYGDMYLDLKDATDIMRKRLYATLKFPQKPAFSCELVKEPTEFQNAEIFGDFEQSVEFRADGQDFINTKIADKMWHEVYHVLEDYDVLDDLLKLIATDDTQSEEMIESNVVAGKLGLFSGELVIKEIGIYWEKEVESPYEEIDEETYYYGN